VTRLVPVAALWLAMVISPSAVARQATIADASALAAEIEKTGSAVVYGLDFETGKATFTRDSEPALRQVLALTEAHEDWRFEVQGHAYSLTSKQANQILSGERARLVVQWLVKHGVDKARLIAKGYGDTQPIADDNAAQAKAKNSRIELKKL
jgi:OmpA-OmpF porin, OOP family